MTVARLGLVLAIGVSGCISSPTVELVDPPGGDASTLAADASDAGAAEAATDAARTPTPTCDARCAAAGGTCTADVCTFTCPGGPACDKDIRCPSGMACSVTCSGRGACRGVVCLDTTSCTISCDGDDACGGTVGCGGAQCTITCTNRGCKIDDVRCCAKSCLVNGIAGNCR